MTDKETCTVYIDGDNCNSKDYNNIIAEISKNNNVSKVRLYGDFQTTEMKSWYVKSLDMGIEQVQCPIMCRKNSTDIRIMCDIMEDLFTKTIINTNTIQNIKTTISTFILISSDCDYTHVANKVKDYGMSFIVYGSKSTSNILRNSCTEFKLIPNRNDTDGNDSSSKQKMIKVERFSTNSEMSFVKSVDNLLPLKRNRSNSEGNDSILSEKSFTSDSIVTGIVTGNVTDCNVTDCNVTDCNVTDMFEQSSDDTTDESSEHSSDSEHEYGDFDALKIKINDVIGSKSQIAISGLKKKLIARYPNIKMKVPGFGTLDKVIKEHMSDVFSVEKKAVSKNNRTVLFVIRV